MRHNFPPPHSPHSFRRLPCCHNAAAAILSPALLPAMLATSFPIANSENTAPSDRRAAWHACKSLNFKCYEFRTAMRDKPFAMHKLCRLQIPLLPYASHKATSAFKRLRSKMASCPEQNLLERPLCSFEKLNRMLVWIQKCDDISKMENFNLGNATFFLCQMTSFRGLCSCFHVSPPPPPSNLSLPCSVAQTHPLISILHFSFPASLPRESSSNDSCLCAPVAALWATRTLPILTNRTRMSKALRLTVCGRPTRSLF